MEFETMMGFVFILIIIAIWLLYKYRRCPKCGMRGTMRSAEGDTWCTHCSEIEQMDINRERKKKSEFSDQTTSSLKYLKEDFESSQGLTGDWQWLLGFDSNATLEEKLEAERIYLEGKDIYMSGGFLPKPESTQVPEDSMDK